MAPSASTSIPVYDTAWQMLVSGTPAQADNYFAALKQHGFTGAWTAVIHHSPATYANNYAGGGKVGNLVGGKIVLTPGYINHVNSILDQAHKHDMSVGLLVAWQNLYLPGGGSDDGVALSDTVRGTLDTSNAYAYGQQMVDAFGSHPAVNMWVFGGDAGTNNTADNIAVWRTMKDAIRDSGSTIDIGIHLPPVPFDPLLYRNEGWLAFGAPEIGHLPDPVRAVRDLQASVAAYDVPIWMGEARYYNSNFAWLAPQWRNPGAAEMRADAQYAKQAGVSGYLYGDAGRWNWCSGHGDTTPCDRNNIAASFGPGEAAVMNVFAGSPPIPTTTSTTTTTPTTTTTTTTATVSLVPVPRVCDRHTVTVDLERGQTPTNGDDVIYGTDGADVIDALGGNDIVCGGPGNDIIHGGPGADRLFGNGGKDRLFGGTGRDRLQGHSGRDRLYGGAQRDTLIGNSGLDRLYGGAGSDLLVGGSGGDVLRGGGGNDRMRGGAGKDRADGGRGVDVCSKVETETSC